MSVTDRLVQDYLARLESELSGIPRSGRREVLDEIRAHIVEASTELPPEDESGMRNVLERLGEPGEIAAEARARFGVLRAQTTWREIGALLLLPFGGLILPVLGWFAGVVLLWVSDVWSARDKAIGTLLVPAGMAVAVLVWLVHPVITRGVGLIFLLGLALFLAAVAADVYLITQLRRRRF